MAAAPTFRAAGTCLRWAAWAGGLPQAAGILHQQADEVRPLIDQQSDPGR